MSRRARGASLLVAVALVVAGVAIALVVSRPSGPCGADRREALDPRSLQHVLPSTPVPSFPSAAPTSGPHEPTGLDPGSTGSTSAVVLPGAVQVGLLERGTVLVQHRDPADAPALASVVTRAVVVAPNPGLDARVVVTAWQVRLRCDAVDPGRITSFVRAHAGHGPGTP